MKKLIIFLLFSLIIASSCTKNDILESAKQESGTMLIEAGTMDETKPGLKAPDLRMLYCEWGWIWENGSLKWSIIWCNCFSIITGNCLPDVIIIAERMAAYESFKTHFNNGTLSEFFTDDDYRSVFPGLDELGIVDELVNGDILLYLHHDIVVDKDFYFGLPAGIKYSVNDTSWMSKTKCVLVIEEDL
jgi:hypothetical protein